MPGGLVERTALVVRLLQGLLGTNCLAGQIVMGGITSFLGMS